MQLQDPVLTPHRKPSKWDARIRVNNLNVPLSTFESPREHQRRSARTVRTVVPFEQSRKLIGDRVVTVALVLARLRREAPILAQIWTVKVLRR